jgi:bifunctional non-homologous end joining protein LigD
VLRYSDHIAGNGRALFTHACTLKLEGVVSKRRDQPYQPGRHDSWVKTKCVNRQEFVIGGFTDPEGSRVGVGALLVGYYDGDKRLISAGRVGTGFTNKRSVEMRQRLEALSTDKTPFAAGLDTWLARHAHFVRPELVAEVAFTEWTSDGNIRHPSFKGLRLDKRPVDIHREQADEPPAKTAGVMTQSQPVRSKAGPPARRTAATSRATSGAARTKPAAAALPEVGGVRITHPDRLMYPEAGLTKLDLARYYEAVADRMLPHLRGRPLTLVRCGDGLPTGDMRADCIYMKHSKVWAPEALRRVRLRERTKTGDYVIADTLPALVSLVQMDILEIHTWNSTFEHLEQPDRLVFDIDPGPEAPWAWVVEAARLVRSVLTTLGLESFVKTTGGKGLHVVAPLVPSISWDAGLEFSRQVATAIVRTKPDRYTTKFAKAGRERQLLIDYLRNNRTNTSVAVFSTRARPTATVSAPIAWDDLTTRLRPDQFTVKTLSASLARKKHDPWDGYWTVRQKLTARALKAVARS